MYKTVVDKITQAVALMREKRVPECALELMDEVNNLEKHKGRNLLQGTLQRNFLVMQVHKIKSMKLAIDYRPISDVNSRLDFLIDIRCMRNGKQVDKLVLKHTIDDEIKSDAKNILEFKISHKRLLREKAVNDGDILVVTLKQANSSEKPIYFANMYITKE